MAISLKKSFDIDKWLNEYARQKKLALCMWYDIIIALQHEDFVRAGLKKHEFVKKHNLHWFNDCFLCHLFMKFKNEGTYTVTSCTGCPLEKKYKGEAEYGCGCTFNGDKATPWRRVINTSLPKEERIDAAWEIIEAIKSI